jgi:hypothetical protein
MIWANQIQIVVDTKRQVCYNSNMPAMKLALFSTQP